VGVAPAPRSSAGSGRSAARRAFAATLPEGDGPIPLIALRTVPKLSLALAAALLMTLTGCGGLSVMPETSIENATHTAVLDEVAAAAAISAYRVQHGLNPVVVDPALVKAAAFQAGNNARHGQLSHEVGGSFTSRMASAGFAKAWAAENLSAGSETLEQVLARWKASPEHNKNMLLPQIRRIGIARVDAPTTRYKRFWALVMAGS
jgi:uncharacterized protein YkwD